MGSRVVGPVHKENNNECIQRNRMHTTKPKKKRKKKRDHHHRSTNKSQATDHHTGRDGDVDGRGGAGLGRGSNSGLSNNGTDVTIEHNFFFAFSIRNEESVRELLKHTLGGAK